MAYNWKVLFIGAANTLCKFGYFRALVVNSWILCLHYDLYLTSYFNTTGKYVSIAPAGSSFTHLQEPWFID